MKFLIIIVAIFCLSTSLCGQVAPVKDAHDVDFCEPVITKPNVTDTTLFYAVEHPAAFPGGPAALKAFIDKEIKNLSCIAIAESKKSYIKFIVERDGRITQPEIIKGSSCDEAALLIISRMPHWEAGRQNGKIVRSQFILKIEFTINTP